MLAAGEREREFTGSRGKGRDSNQQLQGTSSYALSSLCQWKMTINDTKCSVARMTVIYNVMLIWH
jgi:hypothetical protein